MVNCNCKFKKSKYSLKIFWNSDLLVFNGFLTGKYALTLYWKSPRDYLWFADQSDCQKIGR